MSDTPMTDAIFKKYETGYCGISQIRLHCDDLEVQLAEAQAELKDVYKDRLFLKGDNDRLEKEIAEADKKIKFMQNEYIEVVHDMIAKHELQLAEAQRHICDSCSPDDYGWNYNAVEGRVPCTCITESGAYQELERQLAEAEDQLNKKCCECFATATLRDQLAEAQARIKELEGALETIERWEATDAYINVEYIKMYASGVLKGSK